MKNGNNINFSTFHAWGNPNLTCIQVDDVSWAITNWTNRVDSTATFSEDCGPYVYIPDTNFKALLLANSFINSTDDGEISFSEAAAYTGTINAYSSGIADITGLEAFTATTAFNCGFNQLDSLNVSANVALTTLYCNGNPLLSSLDVSANTHLTVLSCGKNHLTSLNVKNGNNTNFTFFGATKNPELICIEVDDDEWSTDNWTNIDDIAFFSEACGSIGIAEKNSLFSIYPNPTKDNLTIETQQLQGAYLLCDVMGKVLQEGNITGPKFSLDMSSLGKGVYFLTLTDDNKQINSKIFKE